MDNKLKNGVNIEDTSYTGNLDDYLDDSPTDTIEEELLEKARIVLQSNSSTGFSDTQKPSEKEMADLINEVYLS